jgi:hypothetical protein
VTCLSQSLMRACVGAFNVVLLLVLVVLLLWCLLCNIVTSQLRDRHPGIPILSVQATGAYSTECEGVRRFKHPAAFSQTATGPTTKFDIPPLPSTTFVSRTTATLSYTVRIKRPLFQRHYMPKLVCPIDGLRYPLGHPEYFVLAGC